MGKRHTEELKRKTLSEYEIFATKKENCKKKQKKTKNWKMEKENCINFIIIHCGGLKKEKLNTKKKTL